jgi:hypothetical protein
MPLPVILILVGFAVTAAIVGGVGVWYWLKTRPTFVTPKHRVRVFILDPLATVSPAYVDVCFDILIAHAMGFYARWTPPDGWKLLDDKKSVQTQVRECLQGSRLELDVKNIVPSYMKAQANQYLGHPHVDVTGYVMGMSYPDGVVLRLDDIRTPQAVDLTLATSALAHENMGHRCLRALYGQEHEDQEHKLPEVWKAAEDCRLEMRDRDHKMEHA